MPLQYIGIRVCGRPNEILDKVRAVVRRLGVGHVVPVMFHEKKSKGEFYVFLGFEHAQVNVVPEQVGQVVEQAGFTSPLRVPFTHEQIKGMIDPQEFDTSGTDRIPYCSRWVEATGDLFDLAEALFRDPPTEEPELSTRHDQLLAWLSAAGGGRWESFERASILSGVAGDNQQARNIYRMLNLLGHIEPSSDGREWSACPPVLVRRASAPTDGFLCGLRSPSWCESVRAAQAGQVCEQPRGVGPRRVSFGVPDGSQEGPSGLPIRMRIEPLAVTVLGLLPDLGGWERELEQVVGLTNPQKVERWEGQGYAEVNDFYYRGGGYHGRTGLYRAALGDGRSTRRLSFFFDEPSQRIVRGDWCGLRFLARQREGAKNDALWQAGNGTGELIVAGSRRWPLLYERTLVLCSGLLPEENPRTKLLHYAEIPLGVAQGLSSRLGVSLETL